MSRTLLALAAALAVNVSAHAAQDPASAALPGRVSATSLNPRDARLSKAETAAMAAEVERLIFAPLLASPALANPRGFAIARQLIVAPPPEGMSRTGPSIADGHMLLRDIDLAHGSKPDASGAYNGVGEGPGIRFSANDPTALYPWPAPEEGREAFYDLDPRAPQRDGFLVLRFRSKDHIVLAKPGRKPYRHVTKAEVLQRELADRRKDLDKLGVHAAPSLRQDHAAQEAELAALSPADRAAPACLGASRKRGTFTPCGEAGANYVVAIDPGYFDASLPRTAIQLVVLSVGVPNHRDEHKVLGPVTRAAVEALDLAAIQRALK